MVMVNRSWIAADKSHYLGIAINLPKQNTRVTNTIPNTVHVQQKKLDFTFQSRYNYKSRTFLLKKLNDHGMELVANTNRSIRENRERTESDAKDHLAPKRDNTDRQGRIERESDLLTAKTGGRVSNVLVADKSFNAKIPNGEWLEHHSTWTTNVLLLPKHRFRCMINRILEEMYGQTYTMQKEAKEALQEAAEGYLISLFEDTVLCAELCDTSPEYKGVITYLDWKLAECVRGDIPVYLWSYLSVKKPIK